MNKKLSYHHGDLKRTLIDVSLKVVEEHGVGHLNLRELAKRAGVSSGAPYHHFADRSALLSAIAREGFERLESSMLRHLSSETGDAGARLEALGRAYVLFALSHPGHFKVMFRGDVHDRADLALSRSGERAFQLLRDAVCECQNSGVAPKGDPEPYVLHAWATVHGLAELLVDGGLKNISIDADRLPGVITGLTRSMFGALAEAEIAKSDDTHA